MTTTQPLVSHLYFGDPRAHVFDGKLYIYPSHDIDTGAPQTDEGDHFDMHDYHVLSLDRVGGEVTDHGVALHIDGIPWAARQLWSNDAAYQAGTYYLYFPAKDKQDIFRIGVATSPSPSGPFTAEPEPIEGSFSIDPCAFEDHDGQFYLCFGGLWGGQLQRWQSGTYNPNVAPEPDADQPALGPRIARLRDDMRGFAEPVREIRILDQQGNPILATDHARRFFEAVWLHSYNGKYYLSYSTGDTHLLVYAVGDNPYGPFTYGGVLLTPVVGWTTHHSIVKFQEKWYLFYHDASLSGGRTHLRSPKVTELTYRPDGSIVTIDGSR